MTTTATRLITLIMLLQRHPNQKAGELAGELGISVRTLHRYFTLLDEMWGELYREAARGALAKLGNLLPEQQRDEVIWARRGPAHCWRIPINPGHAVRSVLADSLHRKYFHFRERLGYAWNTLKSA